MIIKLFLFSYSLVLSLLLADSVLRLSGYVHRSYSWRWAVTGFFNPHAERIYALSPNITAPTNAKENTDRHGFRRASPDDGALKTGSVVAMFGDSFVYGQAVNDDETYPYYVQQALRSIGTSATIVNAGVPGYGMDQTYLYIREVVGKHKPDVIVWNININDIGDANDACLFRAVIPNYYVKLPVILQTLYLEGLVVRYASEFIRSSPLINIALHTVQQGHDRYTVGCTLPYGQTSEIRQNALSKLRYFMREINALALASGTDVVYTLLPTEPYFRPDDYSTDSDELLSYTALRQLIQKEAEYFVDFNEALADRYYPKILSARNDNKMRGFAKANEDSGADVLGALTAHPDQLFLEGERGVDFRHLSVTGNTFTGTLMAAELYPFIRK